MTPLQLLLMFKSANERLRRERDDRLHLAWHIARLNAYAPAKLGDFIKLEALTSKKQTPAPQDWRQQLALVSSWVKGRGR